MTGAIPIVDIVIRDNTATGVRGLDVAPAEGLNIRDNVARSSDDPREPVDAAVDPVGDEDRPE